MTAANAPEATVIIATRDRAALLRACLARLARQTAAGRFEVVIVDNGSSDDTTAAIREAHPLARGLFVREPHRGKARNAGIAAARGRILIFCDDDTLAPERFVAAHLAAQGTATDRAVSGPIVNIARTADMRPPIAANYSNAFFCTCNVSVPKAALDGVGGFDESFELYGWEDTDVGVRLRAYGLKRVFAWDAVIYHMKPPESQDFGRRIALAQEKGTMAARFVRKSPTWPVRLATGAYAANFARAAFLGSAPMRALYRRLAGSGSAPQGPIQVWARESLADAAYIDALRVALARDGR